jgi:hypothetical protein
MATRFSRGVTVVPNSIGEALSAASSDIAGMILRGKEQEREDERFEREFGLREREARSAEETAELARNMQRMLVTLAMSPPDVPLATAPRGIQKVIANAMGVKPELLAKDPAYNSLIINPTTSRDKLGEALAMVASERLSDPKIAGLAADFQLLGGQTEGEVDFRQDLTAHRSRALKLVGENEELLYDSGRVVLGLEPGVTIPGIGPGGSSMKFESSTAANLWVQFMKARMDAASAGQTASAASRRLLFDMAQDLRDQMGEFGKQLGVRTVAGILELPPEDIQAMAAGQPDQAGNLPSDAHRVAATLLTEGMNTIEGAYQFTLSQMDGGEEMASFFDLSGIMSDQFGTAQNAGVMQAVTKFMEDEATDQGFQSAVPVFQTRSGFLSLGGPKVRPARGPTRSEREGTRPRESTRGTSGVSAGRPGLERRLGTAAAKLSTATTADERLAVLRTLSVDEQRLLQMYMISRGIIQSPEQPPQEPR